MARAYLFGIAFMSHFVLRINFLSFHLGWEFFGGNGNVGTVGFVPYTFRTLSETLSPSMRYVTET